MKPLQKFLSDLRDARYASIRKDILRAARRQPDAPRTYFKVLGAKNIQTALELGAKRERSLGGGLGYGPQVSIAHDLMSIENPLLAQQDAKVV